MIDPTGFLLTGIRDDSAVAAISTRIRADEPGPDDADWVIDATTKKKRYKNRFVVLFRQGGHRLPRNAVQIVQYGFRVYGLTPQDATAFYGAVSDAAHNLEPRVNGSGIGIWNSRVIEDNGAAVDPDTGASLRRRNHRTTRADPGRRGLGGRGYGRARPRRRWKTDSRPKRRSW